MGWVPAMFALICAAFASTYSYQNDITFVGYDQAAAPYAAPYASLPGQAVYAPQGYPQASYPPSAYAAQPYYNVQQGAPYQPPGQYVPIGRTDAGTA